MAKNKKIVKYRKPIHINIGVIIFSIILLYVIFNIFVYLTKDHISVYEVQQGTIAENNVYSGLVLRSEVPYYSDYTGSLNYYVKDASKVAANQMVYSVDEEGSIASAINDANQDGSKMDSDSLSEVEDSIDNFKNSYSREEFYNTYTFRDDVNSMLNEALSQNALDTLSQDVSTAINNNTFHPVNAAESGVITYYVDGFEGVTVDSFTKEMFQQSNYQKTNLKANVSVSAGDPVYKMINSEIWNIIVPIDETMATRLADHTVVEIKFLKDNKTMYAYYEIREQDGQNYLILTLKSAMIRYAKERYLEIELLLSEESGLKIPNSAITKKEFFTVPIAYFLQGDDSSNLGCLVKKDSGTEFVLPTIYYSDDTYYYIDSEDVQKGDILQKPDSNEQYTIGTDVANLNGVYNVNKGYAVFKQIDVIYQNEEYSILKTGTTYGLSLYDHIALDGSKVTENQLIN
ncbi:MAG: HlyD family efflux transporter periplasmic adaptor subunit [Roseburia sp.]|nr:HlyD family efflux transporter periplasmic adaptor subunit [Roseburia sp.]